MAKDYEEQLWLPLDYTQKDTRLPAKDGGTTF